MAAANLAPTQGLHFWDRNQESHSQIQTLVELGPGQSQEDIVDHVWVAICRVYFPHVSTTPNGTGWAVLQEPYRGTPQCLKEHRPNALAVRLSPQPALGGTRTFRRDFLWVECKSSTQDSPSGWNRLINETVGRLNSAHPQRTVAVIVAIGLNMMAFWWSPDGQIISPRMSIQSAHQPTIWQLDPRLKCWAWGDWVDRTTGRFNLPGALCIDCITQVQLANGQQDLKWRNDLWQVEGILRLTHPAEDARSARAREATLVDVARRQRRRAGAGCSDDVESPKLILSTGLKKTGETPLAPTPKPQPVSQPKPQPTTQPIPQLTPGALTASSQSTLSTKPTPHKIPNHPFQHEHLSVNQQALIAMKRSYENRIRVMTRRVKRLEEEKIRWEEDKIELEADKVKLLQEMRYLEEEVCSVYEGNTPPKV